MIGRCIRPGCNGLLLNKAYPDPEAIINNFNGLSCINCGEVYDLIIMKNREERPHVNNRRWIRKRVYDIKP